MTTTAHPVVTTVRTAVPQDAEPIGTAHAEAWRVAYTDLFPTGLLEAAARERRDQWTPYLVEQKLEMGTLHVAEDEGGVCGFAFGVGDELIGLYLHPRVWGQGHARALLARHVEVHPGDRLVLWTLSGASRARAFYEANGWRMTGRFGSAELVAGYPQWIVEYTLARDRGARP